MKGAKKDFIAWVIDTGLENILWTTDVDETLLEKSTDPNQVTEVDGLEAMCEDLDERSGGGFFIITGRDVGWLDKVFPHKNVRASCEYHCLFRKKPGAEPEVLNPVPEWSLIDDAMEQLVAQSHEGLLLRKKPFMRSLHYVAVPVEEREALKKDLEPKLQALLDQHNEETGQIVGMVDGGKVFDMGPSNSNKSHALLDIFDEAVSQTGRPDLIPIYFGDSSGDVPAAHLVQAIGGKFIAVGDDPAVKCHADFVFKDPAELRAAITEVLQKGPVNKLTVPLPGEGDEPPRNSYPSMRPPSP